MKNLTLKGSLAITILSSLFFYSCKKENIDSSNQQVNSINNTNKEVADDNWNKVSQIPLFVSQQFIDDAQFSNSSQVNQRKTRGGTSGTTDITAPNVTISNPLNGSAVSGNVTITVSASDNVGVSSVTLSVDGNTIGSITAAPYNFLWNSNNAIDGTHTITATAKDAKNNTSSTSITVTKNTIITIPPTIVLPGSLTLITPPISNQGNEGSCVAFATGYAARSIEAFYRTSSTSYNLSSNIFSPEYVYNQTKISSDCNSGTAFTLALDLLKNKGVCTWNSMPYSYINGCSLLPNSYQDAEAANYKITSYAKIINSDQTAIKTMIYNKHAVIINVTMDNGFINATSGFIWKSYSGSGALPHALIICGYDDAKHAYKVMNSVGTNWGDSGFGWIDYDYFPQVASYYLYTMNY